ncbi:hypothetical protein GCM10017562_75560 [Streptomyces roseofulvus]
MSNAQPQPQWGTPAPPAAGQPRRRRPRIFLWVFLAIQVIFLIWIITGAASGSGTPEDCGTLDRQTCNDAESVGTAIGVGMIIFLWAAVDVVLGVTYAIYRFARRP